MKIRRYNKKTIGKKLFEDDAQNVQNGQPQGQPAQQNATPQANQQPQGQQQQSQGDANQQQPQQQNNSGVSTQEAVDWATVAFIFEKSVIGFKQGLVQNLQQSGVLERLNTLNQWVNNQFGQLGNQVNDANSLANASNQILQVFNEGMKSVNTHSQDVAKDANAQKVYNQALTDLIAGKKYDEVQKVAQSQQNNNQPQQNQQQPAQQNTNQPNANTQQQPPQPQGEANQQQNTNESFNSFKLTLNNKLFEDKLQNIYKSIL